MRLAPILAAFLVLSTALAALAPPAATQTQPRWWDTPDVKGPGDYQRGWNLRVPVRVTNTFDYPIAVNHPIQVHLQPNQLAAEAGWIHTQVSGVPVARGFTFNPESVRVVLYGANWAGATLKEVPATVYPSWLEPDQSGRYGRIQTLPFHKTTNPVITVAWLPQASIPPGASAYYYVYLEAEENSFKPPAAAPEHARNLLAGLHWVGRGTELWGHSPGSTAKNLEIVATAANTKVRVLEYKAGFPRPTLRDLGSQANPFTLQNAGDRKEFILFPPAVPIKIEADEPVLVAQSLGTSLTDFVPSLDQGPLGTRFSVTPKRATSVFLLAQDDGATVTIRRTNQPAQTYPVQGSSGFVQASLDADATYTIESDEPILVQPQPQAPTSGSDGSHVLQVPDLHTGSPLGGTFYGSTVSYDRGGLFRFLSLDGVAQPMLFPLPLSDPVFPRLDAPPARLVPGAANHLDIRPGGVAFFGANEYSLPHFAWSSNGTSVPADEQSRFAYFVGRGDPTTSVGGDGGRRFAAPGSLLVFGHYNATTVEVGAPDDDASSTRHLLDRDAYLRLAAPADAWRDLVADKPVTVVPVTAPDGQASYTRYLAGHLPPPRADVLLAEFRGFHVQVRSPDGADPVFVSARPGEAVEVPFEVTNLGRWSGGIGLTDSLHVEAIPPPGFAGALGWDGGALNDTTLTLASQASATLKLGIQVPPDAAAGSSALIQVRAASQGNPNMVDTLRVLVFFEESFGVRLYWESGSSTTVKELIRELPVNSTLAAPFIVENTGSAVDSFRFDASDAFPGWKTRIAPNPTSTQSVSVAQNLEAGEKRRLFVIVESPERTDQEAFTLFLLNAVSTSSLAAADFIQGVFRLDLRREIRVEAPDPQLEILPGKSVDFAVELRNLGEATASANLTLPVPLPAGWNATILGIPAGPGGFEVSLTPGQTLPFAVRVGAPASAKFGALVPVLVQATITNREATGQDVAALVAVVGKVANFTATAPATLEAPANGTLPVSVLVNHTGNAPAEFTLRPETLPPGWRPDSVPQLLLGNAVDAGGFVNGHLDVNVSIPDGTQAGTYTLRLRVLSRDGIHRDTTTLVVVRERLGHILGLPDGPVRIGPAEQLALPVALRNDGNQPLTYRLAIEPPPGWEAGFSPSVATLLPQRNATLLLRILAPRLDVVGTHELRVTLRAGDTEPASHGVVEMDFRMPDPAAQELRAITPRARIAGDVVFFVAAVANLGQAVAIDVPVTLVVDGEREDTVLVGRIRPNATAYVTLQMVWPGGEPAIRVHVDPDGAAPDANPANNEAEVAAGPASEPGPIGIPGTAAMHALLLLGFLVLARRRRRAP